MAEEQKKDKKKVLTAALAAGLAIALAVGGGTYAYLADNTDPVVNEINMNKSLVDIYESDNDYEVIPGTSDDKDPYLVADNTVDSYLYVKVDDETGDLVDWDLADGWTKLDGVDGVYYKKIPANKDGEKTKYQIIKGDKIYYPATVTNNDTTNKDGSLKDAVKLSFTGYIMQEAGFEDDPFSAYYAAAANTSSVVQATANDTAATLTEKIAAADNNSVIVVKNSIETTGTVTIPAGKTVTLALADGKTITSTDSDAVTNNGTLTVSGGKLDATAHAKAALVNNAGATAKLDGVTLTRSKEAGVDYENNGDNSYYVIKNEGTMTLDNCTVEAKGGYSSLVENIGTADAAATMTINGGTYTGGINTVKNDDYGVLVINDGTFTNTVQDVVLNYGTATINGGTFNAQVYEDVVNDETGKITITGGTFNTTGGYCCVDNFNENSGAVTVTGGTFNTSCTYAVYGNGTGIVTVSGGTYNVSNITDNDSECIASGHTVKANGDGTYSVVAE